ncbi:MAG: Smr/MutS family protein [Alphaproteobacteria bacterium]
MKKRNQKDGKSKNRRPVLNPDDEELFLSLMKGVQRQSETTKKDHYTGPSVSKTFMSRNPDIKRNLPLMSPNRNIAPLAAGRSADLDKRTLERLRRGLLRPEARLDLHGMTQDQAYPSLMSFLEASQAGGKRCVIVITGRGRMTDGGGILRRETPGWLNSSTARSRVLGFATARPRDGGVGALYVLLRRAR